MRDDDGSDNLSIFVPIPRPKTFSYVPNIKYVLAPANVPAVMVKSGSFFPPRSL